MEISEKQLVEHIKMYKKNFSSKSKNNSYMRKIYESYCTGKVCETLDLYFSLQIPQSYGPKMEKFFIKKHGMQKVASSLDRGDFKNDNENYYEHKFSYIKEQKFNFVQIRPWQDLKGYALEVLREGSFSQFYITKKDMNRLLEKYGNMAHGTKKAVSLNINKEYALRGNYSSDLWKDLQRLNKGKSFLSC